MPVYLINSYDIIDQQEFNSYIPLVGPIFQRYGGEVVVADFAAESIEGNLRQVNSVVKFPSKEAAISFYNDPDYQAAKVIRHRSTANNTIVLAKEWVKPE